MAGHVTLSQVAHAAGVSLATASRAINGSATRTVQPELRARVVQAAERLGYSPDANAQAIARGRTTSLGLVVHNIADPYFSSIAAGVTEAADRAGLVVTLASTQHEPDREPTLVDLLTRQRARAIVLAGGRHDDPELQARMQGALDRFRGSGGSVALVGQPGFGVDAVVIDNREAAARLARTLHGLGYRRFGVLAGPPGNLTARDRHGGFADALRELGCPPDAGAVIWSAFTRDGGYEAMRELLASPHRVDLVFAVTDVMAVGAMAAARDLGVHVPGTVAVAGFDDIDTLRDISPGLTTVHVPLVEVGAQATDLALAPAGDAPRLVHIEASVVVRESTPHLAATPSSFGPSA